LKGKTLNQVIQTFTEIPKQFVYQNELESFCESGEEDFDMKNIDEEKVIEKFEI
jgi:hypothetical protein